MMEPESARSIAMVCHYGQRDRFGDPVVEHLARVALHPQVLASGRDVGVARKDGIVVLGFLHRDLAQPVQALGEHAREVLRHVLHDHDAGADARQRSQHLFERLGATGRRADGHDPLGRLRHGP